MTAPAPPLITHASSIQALAGRWLAAVAGDGEVRGAGGDFACSPAGLWLALAAVAAGAEGETAAELRELLGTAGPAAAREVTDAARALAATDALSVATGVWSRVTVRDAYRAALPDVGFGPLGDPARIDAWVREATGGLIDKLPAKVTGKTRLLLVNALALKARWEQPFQANNTEPRDFRDARGDVHRVPTMHRGIRPADAWTTPEGVTVVELRCRPAADGAPGARVRLVLGEPGAAAAEVLPAAWSRTRVPLDSDQVTIALPRLALRTTITVTGHFDALGLRLVPTSDADFSLLSAEPLFVDQVRQECVLKVAELGVEAAAVTAALLMRTSARIVRRPLRIAFDRPFGVVVLPADGDAPLFAAWQATAPRESEPPAYELDEGEQAEVWRTTFVPFLPDGRCVAVVHGDGSVRLPSGDVRGDEVWLRDTALRIPLEDAGFRIQRVRPFAYEAAGRHVFARVEGDRYEGRRPHATVPWRTGSPQEVAAALTDPRERAAVLDADRSRRAETDETFFADSVRQTELAYLRGGGPESGSGFGAGPEQWRLQRRMVVAGVHKDGTFLDLGCANGLLMESVVRWAAEDGRSLEPYGVDLAPGLVAEARRRLPHWADRIEVGNALDWLPADGRRFDFVHLLADLVPSARFPDLVRHALAHLVAPGGRLLVSVYQPEGGTAPDASQRLTALGLQVAGSATASTAPHTATTAWPLP